LEHERGLCTYAGGWDALDILSRGNPEVFSDQRLDPLLVLWRAEIFCRKASAE
jgi:hypothetical protein